jgi:signal transduction histidine kinase
MNERLHDRGLGFECNMPDEPLYLWGDERKLKQILINLLSNAVKFTPEGGNVTLDVDFSGNDSIEFRVIDTGIGMSPSTIPLILQPFTQAESALHRKYEGTGLGLPLTKALVELHGGTLELRSQLGEGTTAIVALTPDRRIFRNPGQNVGSKIL